MTASAKAKPRRLILLGSTGSIGVSTLEVIEHLRDRAFPTFEVVGLAAGARSGLLAEQVGRVGARHAAVADPAQAEPLNGIEHVYAGPQAATHLVEAAAEPGDLVVAAMVGSAGLEPVLTAIDRGCDVALANKETLVAAGSLVVPAAREKGVALLPIDSEHSAIFQCLRSGRSADEIGRIILTASGGPFRGWTKQQLDRATVDQALNHPTWDMGPKITIDSATLMNKALEIIEAHWLFDLPAEKIEVLVHPQSLIHGMVEFVDGSVVAQLGPPDMRTPIQFALTWPNRLEGCSRTMNWQELGSMDFEPVDEECFGALALARRVIEVQGTAGAILNAANEAAVAAFLDRRIAFPDITNLVREAMDAIAPAPIRSLQDMRQADRAARGFVAERIMSRSASGPVDRVAGRTSP
ncbi:MAG: 1-deoxy-D-xylulose-5-phosphate reductoisomerase [Phycisphaerales bacterium]|nr:MAG: 1-deoxy-D-xylulose-5-phosphate reductoisomerase [Phycisphaerales bacterium]